MKKVCCILLILGILFLPQHLHCSTEGILAEQKEELNISSFIKEANQYTKDTFPNLNMGELFNSAIIGDVDNGILYKAIVAIIGKEIISGITALVSILVIIVIHSILKTISEGLENKGVSQITYYVEYILIVTLIMTNFTSIIEVVRQTIQNLVGFMNSLTPILITLMITTGNITTANVIQPVILFLISFIGNGILTVILPLLLVSTVLGIVSNISDKIQINKLSKYFKSSIVWILGIALTIFVGALSIEGTLTSSVDGLTAKTAKAAVSNFIPVVGKILGDAVDTVIGCSAVLKNAVGLVGIIIIIGICILPIIRLSILTISYYLATAICEVIADEKIVKLLEQMAGSFKILLAILFATSTMLLIGVTLVIKISNSGLMYR